MHPNSYFQINTERERSSLTKKRLKPSPTDGKRCHIRTRIAQIKEARELENQEKIGGLL